MYSGGAFGGRGFAGNLRRKSFGGPLGRGYSAETVQGRAFGENHSAGAIRKERFGKPCPAAAFVCPPVCSSASPFGMPLRPHSPRPAVPALRPRAIRPRCLSDSPSVFPPCSGRLPAFLPTLPRCLFAMSRRAAGPPFARSSLARPSHPRPTFPCRSALPSAPAYSSPSAPLEAASSGPCPLPKKRPEAAASGRLSDRPGRATPRRCRCRP